MRKPIFPHILIIFAAILIGGCHLLTPPDPPYEPKTLNPDDVAWDKLDIARVMEFTGVSRIDCSKVQSILTGSGKCLPHKMPIGNGIRCELTFPAKELIFACLAGNDAPAVYMELTYVETAKLLYLHPFSACHIETAGMTEETRRYPTDIGYRACIFDTPEFLVMPDERYAPKEGQKFVSEIRKDPTYDRPVGIFVDFHDNDNTDELLEFINKAPPAPDAPMKLVADGRFLTEDERNQLLQNIFVIFKMYRNYVEPEQFLPN